MARKTKIAITIDTPLLRDIDRIAKAEGRSRSFVLEQAAREVIGARLDVVKAMSNPTVAAAFANALGEKGVLREMVKALGAKASGKDIAALERAVSGVVDSLHPNK